MQAIILAAGYATRLSPLTDNLPKALLPIGGETMLDHLVDSILSIGEIARMTVVTNEKFHLQFEEWAAGRRDDRIAVLNDGTTLNGERLGAIGDIDFTVRSMGIDGDCLIVAGDNYLTIDMRAFYRQYMDIGRKPLLLAQRTDDLDMLRRFGVASIDEAGRVTKLVEKPQEPESDLAVFALYLYPREVIRRLPEYMASGRSVDSPGNFSQWLSEIGDVYIHVTERPCFDIGTHETLAEVRARAAKGEFR